MTDLPALCGPQLLHADPAALLRLLVLAPLLEEWIVRAGLQAWLHGRRAGPALELLAPALVFCLLHAGSGWGAVAAVFGPALTLGWLYRRWRSWQLCAGVHSLMNAFALTFCSLNTH